MGHSPCLIKKMNEQSIIRRLKKGDSLALAGLMDIYQDYVFTIAMRMVKTRETAEEITQDVFVKVYNKIETFEARSKFSTWIFTIVYHSCLNYLQKKQIVFPESSFINQQFDGDESSDFESADIRDMSDSSQLNSEKQEILWRAIDQLNADQGVIISLYYLQQFSVKEIAEIMNIPSNTVKTHLHRARGNLRDILIKKYVVEDLL